MLLNTDTEWAEDEQVFLTEAGEFAAEEIEVEILPEDPDLSDAPGPMAEDDGPAYEDVEPADRDVEPVYEDVEPADRDVEPADKDVEPVYEDVEPADKDVEPVYEDVEPADEDGVQAETAEIPEGKDGSTPVRVVGVRFRGAGKVYYFDPGDLEIRRGEHVIVETARGIEYGYAAGGLMEVEYRKVTQPLRKVLRIATEEDRERNAANRAREKNALRICRQKIADRGMEMKLIDAEYTFDNSKILFYFTAEGRVDFRELVKALAGVFHTRIELRQIGVRDETRILGGYGICGRPLCCHTWLNDFVPVSIKMAKEQNLSLNPGKISGVCGRLMCCLKNETETYEELNKILPRPGDEVEGRDGLQGQVESVNVLRQTVRILVEVNDEKEYHEYGVEDLTIIRRRRKGMSRRPAADQNPKQEKSGTRQEKGDRSARKGERGSRQERPDRKGDREEHKNTAPAAEEKRQNEGRRPRRHRKKENKEQ